MKAYILYVGPYDGAAMKRWAAAVLVALAACSKKEPPKAPRGEAARKQLKELLPLANAYHELDRRLAALKRAAADAAVAGDDAKRRQLETQMPALAAEHGEALRKAKAAMQAAFDAAEEGLRASPNDADCLEVRAVIAIRLRGAEEEGVADLEKVAAALPSDPVRAATVRASMHRVRREYARARAAVAEAVRSGNPTALAEDGAAAFFLGEFETAAARLEEAAKRRGEIRGMMDLGDFESAHRAARDYLGFWREEQARRETEAKLDTLPRVRLETSKGSIVLELFEDDAPNTVANFVDLVDRQFYDGTKFHRVIAGFMAQGGDPLSKDDDPRNDGSGGPGYMIADELPEKHRRHFRGSLSMANRGPDTNGSQFFLTHVPTEHLNGKHTVFGRVMEGLEVLDALAAGDELKHAVVVRKRDHAYRPTPKE
jgi:cyclophilin family peptidyl-prolyl cis-trans isomerase